MVICLKRGANDLHVVQLMPLPPVISRFINIQNGLSFWCRFTQVVPEKAVKRMYFLDKLGCILCFDTVGRALEEHLTRKN